MTIYEQIQQIFGAKKDSIINSNELKLRLQREFGTNPGSVNPSDYCYNRYNKGIRFNQHLFEYINKNIYKYLGKNYPYTGLIFHKSKGHVDECIVGEWKDGVKNLYTQVIGIDDALQKMGNEQNVKLYADYNRIMNYEMNLLGCQPTELRHLTGRIGEFLCAIETNGMLARETNQHGFDVISNGRKISVKTTAQKAGFITFNQNTFSKFDDVFVVQYIDEDFNVIYYGPKEKVQAIARVYLQTYEVDIQRLKALNFGMEKCFTN